MSFINTISESEAIGVVKEMYENEKTTRGYLPNFAKLFSLRPKVMGAWRNLIRSIIENMDTRRYELVTLAAAGKLRSSYCMLAHGSVLKDKFFSSEQLSEIIKNPDSILLTSVEKAIMRFAQNIVVDAASITQKDVDVLRNLGLEDEEIFEIVTVTTARCFFSKTLDALGAEPDKIYSNLDEKLRNSLTVGRSLSDF
jgi:uncharacterized peroxidase-related enzyme